jgi:multicomponent Na+:H+ antiporter subunit B
VSDLPVVRAVSRWSIPFILAFGLFVGGFPGGVVIAAAFILYGIVWGAPAMRRIVPRWATDWLAAGGLLVYAALAAFGVLAGHRFLDFAALLPGDAAWGVIISRWGVGLTVAAVVITMFNEITEGTSPEQQESDSGTV